MRLALSVIFITIISLFLSCTSKAQKKSDFVGCDTMMVNKYITDLKANYKNYDIGIDSQVERPIGFIDLYFYFCAHDTNESNNRYKIINVCNVFGLAKGKEENLFYSEWICFRNVAIMDSIILEIKKNNCIDPYNLKLNRIYTIGTNEALFVNFYPTFDVPDFEKFLMSEFGRNLKIMTINTPDIREVPQNIRDRMKKG